MSKFWAFLQDNLLTIILLGVSITISYTMLRADVTKIEAEEAITAQTASKLQDQVSTNQDNQTATNQAILISIARLEEKIDEQTKLLQEVRDSAKAK